MPSVNLTPAATERDTVRELARHVAAIAASPENQAIQQRWRDVNALRKPDRAPVWCRPVGCWRELLPPEALACTTPALQSIEAHFRKILIKHDIGDDSPVEPWFDVNAVFDVKPANVFGLDIARSRPDEADGAWAYDPPLRIPADLDRLAQPSFTFNREETDRRLDAANELLGDILPVRRQCPPPLSATLGTFAAELRGLTQMMMDTITEPGLLNRLMAHLRDSVLRAMDQVEATGLLTPNNRGPMTCSDPLAPTPADGKHAYTHCWCMANSQEFDQVSPAMWEEFCLQYQMPILTRFGAVGYGCCENLTRKINGVLRIPNLRTFTCSAWTNLDRVLEQVDSRYCIMWRQKASDVVYAGNTAAVRRDLEEGARKLQGRPYQIVLRELQTLCGRMDRLHVWTDTAKEMATVYA